MTIGVINDLRNASAGAGDNGRANRHCLKDDDSLGLVLRTKRKHRGTGHQTQGCAMVNRPDELHS